MNPRRLTHCLVLLLSLLAGTARALPGEDRGKIILLGITQDRRPNEAARRAVEERLLAMGEAGVRRVQGEVRARSFSSTAQACLDADPACLDAVAQRERAPWVLGGEIRGSEGALTGVLWLYDARSHRVLTEEPPCNDCDPKALLQELRSAAGSLIDRARAGERPVHKGGRPACPECPRCLECPSPPPCPTLTCPPAPPAQPQPARAGLSRARVAGAALLGALGGALTVGGIGMILLEGMGTCAPATQPGGACAEVFSKDIRTGGIVAVSAGGLMLLGMVVTIAAPEKKKK